MTPIDIKVGGYQPATSIHNRAAAVFGQTLERKLGGRVAFQLIGNVLALGRKSGDLPQMVERGELSCCYISTVRFTKAVPEFAMFELPFVVKDRDSVQRAFETELGDTLRRRMLERTGLRVLGFWDNGFRHFSNRVRPIRTPQDCRGLRIRTQMSPLHAEVLGAFGFEPIPADIKEFVEQIGGDRFDAQENPLTNIYHFGVHKHHRHVTMSGHFFGAAAFVCNEEHYRSWPAEVQSAVTDAARDATALQWVLAATADSEVLTKLDPRENEVHQLNDVERAAFVAAVQPVVKRHRKALDPRLLAFLEG